MQADVVVGDAFEELVDLPDDHAHATIIDYPWKFSCRNGTGRFEYRNKPSGVAGKAPRDIDDPDAMYRMEDADRLPELLDELQRVVVDGGWLLFMADDNFQDDVRSALDDHDDLIRRRNWCWTPESPALGYYGRVDHYPIPTATNGETERTVSRGTLYRIPGGRNTNFTTGKPVQLYRELLAPPVLKPGERLLEPFCGSAPGAAVAAERGLDYWGCDIDDEAVAVARDRLKQPGLGVITGYTDD